MHEVYEFSPLNEKFNRESKLFNSIRESMIYRIDLLIQNERILKEAADAARQINSAISSDNLAKTNIKMQNSMRNTTIVILFLTIISTFSAVVSITGVERIKEVKNDVIHLYHEYITNHRSE